MNLIRQTAGQYNRWAVVLGVTILVPPVTTVLPFSSAFAQHRQVQPVYIIDADGAGPDFDTRPVQPGFALFAMADAAHSGMRATGNYGTGITNYGDCNSPLFNCQNSRVRNRRGGTTAPYFEVQWAFAAPPSQFVKIRNVAPSIANAGGGGWTAGYNRIVLGEPLRFGPHDGTVGRMFSGLTATTDGSCRDHTGFANGTTLVGTTKAGLQVLPTSDCPETWGTEGWRGAHPIDETGWAAWHDARGAAFTFDFWRVPERFRRLDRPFLGTNHHTYGETSDFNVEVLANYGSVIPGGIGAPRFQGYPLGLLIRFEAFNFAQPSVSGAYFVQATIVNRSEDVWGQPIDYDSLYFGLSQGTLFAGTNSRYALPEGGVVVYHVSNVQGPGGPCDDPSRFPYGGGCSGGAAAGYGSGATAIIFLKTPLGDLRNKLFTRTQSGDPCVVDVDPLCAPLHPLRGDTITFNRQTFGDFGGADSFTWGTGAREAFGLMSATEANTLAGRDPTAFNDRTLYTTFRSELWPGDKIHYNKYVPPGHWDYDHDGILDTLALDTCGMFGCVDVDSDTMPGGFINRRGNIGGLQSFGPFRLAARDTTSLVYAHVGEIDSLPLWGAIDAVIDLYLGFYLTADAPPPPRVVATQVTPGLDQAGTADPRVRFYLSDETTEWVDPYLAKVADDLDAAVPGTLMGDLAALNPQLASQVRVRAANNVEQLEIYKSCDGGTTFTADADCDPDPTADVDGSSPGLGWQRYAAVRADALGNIPNVFTDDAVQDGRTYLYVVVAKSRGATFLVSTATGPDTVTFAPSLRNVLSRDVGDPNVASIYVPVSRQAGHAPARVIFAERQAGSTVPFIVQPFDGVQGAAYRAVFGNEVYVTRDSLAGQPVFRSTVTIRRREFVDVAGAPVDSIITRERFVYPGDAIFPVAGSATSLPLMFGDTLQAPVTYEGLGFVVVGPHGPVFGSTTLTGPSATPAAVLARPAFPGFVISADNTVAGRHAADAEVQLRGLQALAELGLHATDSVVPRALVNDFMVQWMEGRATRTPDGGGGYEVRWAADPWGVERGFALNFTNPGATAAEVRAALAARTAPGTGVTDAETALLLGVDQTALVPARLPFSIHNLTFDRTVEIAVHRRASAQVPFGSGSDTISVSVPADEWIPGDRLSFIETVTDDSTTPTGLVLDPAGRPVQRARRAVTFISAVLGCEQARTSCNPVLQTTAGATGYLPMRPGDRTRFAYYAGFDESGQFAFDVIPPISGGAITTVTDSALSRIRVVPNPFLIYSAYQTAAGSPRLLFTSMPPRGTLRIYTVAGQLVQQITWEPADLEGDGDLFWNLDTLHGERAASGLYVWVLTAPENPSLPASPMRTARGKFVIVRGDVR